MATQGVKITFIGGTERVTGSNFLIETVDQDGKNWRLLIDCGLIQGTRREEEENWQAFPFDPKSINALLITHAHLDHIGRVPKLAKDGFAGQIFSTPPTRDISNLSLHDSANLLARQAERGGENKLYDEGDIGKAMKVWQEVKYHEPIQLGPFQAVFRDSGHILGSAMVELTVHNKKIVFTGDLGNSPSPLLPNTERITDADYLVIESVYGDRNHGDRSQRKEKLEDVIEQTLHRGGTLVIPAFSIERTQEILFEIEQMVESSSIPLVPVFVDSPLAIKVTSVYQKYKDYLNKDAMAESRAGDGIFRFPNLHYTLTTEESKAIYRANPRKIIMAGSGMSTGGRILHHEKDYLSDPKNTLLLVGYQGVGTLGRIIQDGAKTIKIFGEEIPVRSQVAVVTGYSGHKDSDHLLDFVHQTADTVKKIFVVMGEPKSSMFLVQRIRDYLGLNAVMPKAGETIELKWEV